MKVSELIEKLKEMPQDYEVKLYDENINYHYEIEGVSETIDLYEEKRIVEIS